MRTSAAALLLVLSFTACSPTLDWREVHLAGSGVSALFPCKPDVAQRELDLAGRKSKVSLAGCSAGGQNFSLAWVEVSEPAQVGPALREMREGFADRLGASLGPAHPLVVPGMTPQPEAMQQSLMGARQLARVAVFAHGLRVYQAVQLGARPEAAAWESFVSALRIEP